MVEVKRNEERRGCGFRKPGGLYLVSGRQAAPCGRLPVELTVCRCCGAGIKPSRGWTWIEPTAVLPEETHDCGKDHCRFCPLSGPFTGEERVGLIWIGSKFYPTPESFSEETSRLGVSRRISAVPKDFVVGETWVWLAHRQAISSPCETCGGWGTMIEDGSGDTCDDCDGSGTIRKPGVFTAFRPERIEYILKGTETDEEIERLEARGITPVRLKWDDAPVFDELEEDVEDE